MQPDSVTVRLAGTSKIAMASLASALAPVNEFTWWADASISSEWGHHPDDEWTYYEECAAARRALKPKRKEHPGFPEAYPDATGVAPEQYCTVAQLARRWQLSESKVRGLLEGETRIMRIAGRKARNRRAYVTIRVPLDVVRRIERKLTT